MIQSYQSGKLEEIALMVDGRNHHCHRQQTNLTPRRDINLEEDQD